MAAMHCEGKEWNCWQEFTMTSKFRGKYLQVIPLGNAYVEFNKSGNRYGWRKVTTTIHNIIVGKLWVDHHGKYFFLLFFNDLYFSIKCMNESNHY